VGRVRRLRGATRQESGHGRTYQKPGKSLCHKSLTLKWLRIGHIAVDNRVATVSAVSARTRTVSPTHLGAKVTVTMPASVVRR
jgi:hypothetical protein